MIAAARANWEAVAGQRPRIGRAAVRATWAADQVVAAAPLKASIAAGARRAAPAAAAAPVEAVSAAVALPEAAEVVAHVVEEAVAAEDVAGRRSAGHPGEW